MSAMADLLDSRIAPIYAELEMVSMLVGRISKLEEDNAGLKKRVEAAEETAMKLTARLAEADAVCSRMNVDISNLKKAVREGASAELGSKMVAMQKEVQVLQDAMKSMAVPMETDGAAEPQIKTELAAMRAVVDELKARPSYAAAVGGQGGWTTVPSRPATTGSSELLQFTLTGINVAEGLRGGELGELLVGTIKERIGVSVQIANARILPLGKSAPANNRRRIWFQVVTPLQAKDIVYNRRQLAGTGVVIHDHLSTAEYAIFKALQPMWREAKEAKKRVFWRRAMLFVDGVEVKAPVAA